MIVDSIVSHFSEIYPSFSVVKTDGGGGFRVSANTNFDNVLVTFRYNNSCIKVHFHVKYFAEIYKNTHDSDSWPGLSEYIEVKLEDPNLIECIKTEIDEAINAYNNLSDFDKQLLTSC